MYAYSWFITLFASKLELDPLYRLWNKTIKEADILMVFYLSVAILVHNSKRIFETSGADLPSFITSLTMESAGEVDQVFGIA